MKPAETFQTLSPRDRRALLLGGAAALCIAGGRWGGAAYAAWSVRVEAEAASLARLQAAAAQRARPTAADAASDDSARVRLSRLNTYRVGLVPGPTPAAAAAELGSELRELADDAGLEIGPVTVGVDSLVLSTDEVRAAAGRTALSSRTPSDRPDTTRAVAPRPAGSPYVLVRTNVDGTGPLGAITAFLDDVEAGARRLRVREFAVDPASGSGGASGPPFTVPGPYSLPTPTSGAPSTLRLHVRMVVEGLADRAGPPHVRRTRAPADVAHEPQTTGRGGAPSPGGARSSQREARPESAPRHTRSATTEAQEP